MTARPPFWNATTRQWTRADHLKAGQELLTTSGAKLTLTAANPYPDVLTAYNLTITNLHTYYVLAGEASALVHNCPGPSVLAEGRLGHIEYRHGPGAQERARQLGERNLPGEFSEDFLWDGDVMALGERLRRGVDSSPELPNPRGAGHIHRFDHGSPVGMNGAGQSTSIVEVVVRDGRIWTAYPK